MIGERPIQAVIMSCVISCWDTSSSLEVFAVEHSINVRIIMEVFAQATQKFIKLIKLNYNKIS